MVCLNPLQQELKKAEWPNPQNDNVVETDLFFHMLQCFFEPGCLKECLFLTFSSFIRASHLTGTSSFQILKLITSHYAPLELKKMPNMCMEISANAPTKSMKAKKRCQMSSKLENMNIICWHEWHDQAVDYIVYTPSNSQPFFMWYSCLLLFFFLGLAKTKTMTGSHAMSWRRFFGAIPPLKRNWWVELRSAHSFCQEPFSTI